MGGFGFGLGLKRTSERKKWEVDFIKGDWRLSCAESESKAK
jgi:hypothetical protein